MRKSGFYWWDEKELSRQVDEVVERLLEKGEFSFDSEGEDRFIETVVCGDVLLVNDCRDGEYIKSFYFGKKLLLRYRDEYPGYVELLDGNWSALKNIKEYLEGFE